jgi:DNA-directed RNA polymerase subunit omega
MARVTVEDCIQVVPNRYELVLMAAQRARDISSGSAITVERDNDKNPVIALREIAGQSVNLDEVRKHIVEGVNRQADLNTEDESLLSIANAGIEGEPLNATHAAIEEVLFDGIAPAEDLGNDENEIAAEEAEAGAEAAGAEEFTGAEEGL